MASFYKHNADVYYANVIANNSSVGAAYIYTLGLAYQVTGDSKYASAARTVLLNKISTFDLPHTWASYRPSYWARNYAVQLAIGYDWIYDFLSSDDKTNLIATIALWYDAIVADALLWAGSNPGDNFFWGDIVGCGLMAIASYGDNPRGDEMFDYARYIKYENIGRPAMNAYYKKSAWLPESSGYGMNSLEFAWQYLLALKTSSGEDLFSELFGDPPNTENFIYSLIHGTQPPLASILPQGDVDTDPITDYVRRPMLYVADLYKDTNAGEYAKWYLANAGNTAVIATEMKWLDFLWYDPNATERNINDLPLDYYDDGKGLVFARSGWTTDATWVSFNATGFGTGRQSHQHKDQNSFTIFKNTWLATPDPLIGGYGTQTSIWVNTILIKNTADTLGERGYQSGDSWITPPTIQKYEANTDYTYLLGQAYAQYRYSGRPYIMDNFGRSMVFVRPDYVIVFDRIALHKKSSTDIQEYYPVWTLKSLTEPSISGDTITITNGTGKLFVKSLFYDNSTKAVLGTKGGWDTHLTQSVITNNQHLFLNVMQATDAAVSSMIPTEKIDTSNMSGAKLSVGANDTRIVLFSKTEAALNENIIYNVSGAGASKHLIVDLKPNTQFTIENKNTDTGVVVQTQTLNSSDKGTLYFTTTLGSNHQITIQPQGAAPIPTCSTAGGTCQANVCDTYDTCASLTGTCVTGNCCSGTCTVISTSTPNITLTKTTDKTEASSGQEITYTIAYQNTGSGGATDVVITDPIPTGATYVANSASSGGVLTPSTGSGQATLTWNIGTVAAGASGTVIFRVKVD